jgi:HAD superfamily hydrolase (TIGR01509 family)
MSDLLFEAIIFDCDGVLVDSEVIAAESLARELTMNGFAVDRGYVYTHYLGRSFQSVEVGFERETGGKLPTSFREEWHKRLFEDFRQGLRPIADIESVLRSLPIPYAVASSSAPDRLALTLGLTRLDRYFTGLTFEATMVARGKPAPDLFLLAAERLKVAPRKILVIEDSRSGIEAAVAAGMTPWAFVGGQHFQYRPDFEPLRAAGAVHVFDTMRDLPRLLRSAVRQKAGLGIEGVES